MREPAVAAAIVREANIAAVFLFSRDVRRHVRRHRGEQNRVEYFEHGKKPKRQILGEILQILRTASWSRKSPETRGALKNGIVIVACRF